MSIAVLFLFGVVMVAGGVLMLLDYTMFPLKKGRHGPSVGAHQRSREELLCAYPYRMAVSGFSVVIGLLLLVFCIVPSLNPIAQPFFSCSAAAVMFGAGIYLGIVRPLRCTQRVLARYEGYAFSFRGFASPRFCVEWEGKTYTAATGQSQRVRRLNRLYTESFQYPVSINPRNPYELVRTRRFGFTAGGFFLLGILCLLSCLI